jgi:transposase
MIVGPEGEIHHRHGYKAGFIICGAMSGMQTQHYIPSPVKIALVNAVKGGQRISHVARIFNFPQKTVDNIVKRSEARGTVSRALKSGRPKKTSKRQDKLIYRLSTADPHKTAVDITTELKKHYAVNLHVSTTKRRLKGMGLHGRHGVKKPFVSKKNQIARLEFARAHLNWTTVDWSKILWSDESKFDLFGSDGIHYVRRPVGMRNDVRYQIPTVKHGGGSVMVWGCFSRLETGPIFRIQGNMDRFMYRDILESTMLPYAQQKMPRTSWVFQQDNDPKHTSGLLKEWMRSKKIRLLKWPSQSADLNPIEHLWDELGRRVSDQRCTNLNKLYDCLQVAWNNIPAETITKLVDSMPRRCQAVIDSKGFSTRY